MMPTGSPIRRGPRSERHHVSRRVTAQSRNPVTTTCNRRLACRDSLTNRIGQRSRCYGKVGGCDPFREWGPSIGSWTLERLLARCWSRSWGPEGNGDRREHRTSCTPWPQRALGLAWAATTAVIEMDSTSLVVLLLGLKLGNGVERKELTVTGRREQPYRVRLSSSTDEDAADSAPLTRFANPVADHRAPTRSPHAGPTGEHRRNDPQSY